MAEKENSGSAPVPSNADGQRVYGFIKALRSGKGSSVEKIFGIGQTTVKIGRGSTNDIRLNERMFSRHHVELTITQEENGELCVQLENRSEQKNATKVPPYVLPNRSSVILGNPSDFTLQSRHFQWLLNDGNVDKVQESCPEPIIYLPNGKKYEELSKEGGDYQIGENSGVEHPSQATPTPKNDSPAPRRRSSSNPSLELRKAAHRRSFRSSIRQPVRQSAPLETVEEDLQEEPDTTSTRKSCDT